MLSKLKVFLLFLTILSLPVEAVIYRLPIEVNAPELSRPAPGLRAIPRVFRILNSVQQDPLAATVAIEFEEQNGRLFRTRTYKIDMVKEAADHVITASCMNDLLSKQGSFPDSTITTAVMSTPFLRIGTQALKEMRARQYLSSEDAGRRMAEPQNGLDTQVFFESLSWVESKEAIQIFGGSIPWDRIAEVEAPPGLTIKTIRERAALGDERIRLRVRRATMRLASQRMIYENGIPFRRRLPFEQELLSNRRSHEPIELEFGFELGRTAQIPGLLDEARALSALAARVALQQVVAQKGNPASLENKVFMHSLKPANTALYISGFDAKVVKGLDRPEDTMLIAPLTQMLAKTADLIDGDHETIPLWLEMRRSQRLLLEAKLGEDWMQGRAPIILEASPKEFERIARERARSERALAVLKTPSQDVVPPLAFSGETPSHQWPHNWTSRADYLLSGFKLPPNQDQSLPALLKGLLKTVQLSANIRLMLITGRMEDARKMKDGGFEVFEYVGSDHRVRYFGTITVEKVGKMKTEKTATVSPSREGPNFSLVNLEGFL
jgi:hypothetical protein